MIPDIGVMIGLYIVTKMISFATKDKESIFVRIFAIITIIVAVICVADLFLSGTHSWKLSNIKLPLTDLSSKVNSDLETLRIRTARAEQAKIHAEIEAGFQAYQANIQTAQDQLSFFKEALDVYRIDNKQYPKNRDGLGVLVKKPKNGELWDGPYIKKIPKDPWGHDYIYFSFDESNTYTLISCGPDGIVDQYGIKDDIISNP